MNEDVSRDAFSGRQADWLPDQPGEIEEEQGGDLEKEEGPSKEEAEILCHRSAGSISSRHKMEHGGACPRGLESGDSSAEGQNRPSGKRNEEVMLLIQEMKRCLPAEQEGCAGKTSTLRALQYALKCVCQVQSRRQISPALGEPGVHRSGASWYRLEELAAITSERAPKNTDTFVAVFSLLSGRTVHISEQAASLLHCKQKTLLGTPLAQLLAPQDVSIFYAHTGRSQLPLWHADAQAASLYEYAQAKSFFCRLRAGKDLGQSKCYIPFRITPYLVNVCLSGDSESEPCCLALAERIHSGYEAPRIPLEKRVCTTIHSPSCVFLEADDRVVPLLGYLPQDLISMSVLMYLHPEDRPLMVAVHRKVLRFAGQTPFEHSPIRFCTQNGDYVILDTSWSSFVNPWSRKVAFVIGRHRVRTSPLNEDVFAARSRERNPLGQDVLELQGQIYKILLQPVHSNVSSGYGSLVSNASCERYVNMASSSDSSGNGVEELPREPGVFVDISRLKHAGQQLHIKSHSQRPGRSDRAPGAELPRGKESPALQLPDTSTDHCCCRQELPAASSNDHLSYQQINSMDSIIRYLEGCSIPALKRKCESSANTSSSSEEDKQWQPGRDDGPASGGPCGSSLEPAAHSPAAACRPGAAAAGPPMPDLALAGKALSMGSGTSHCSYSSTLVHVPHPESEVMALEEPPLQGEGADRAPPGAPAAAAPTPVATTLEELRLVGLTKEVLSAHTQKEEQDYMDRFHQKLLLPPYQQYFEPGGARSCPAPSQDQGDFPVSRKQNSPLVKLRCQEAPGSLTDTSLGREAACQKRGAVPSEESPPGPTIQNLPAPLPAAPCFPLDPLGGGSQPHSLPLYLPSALPVLPTPCAGPLMAVLVHSFPEGALFPLDFPPGHPQSYSVGPLALVSAPARPQGVVKPGPSPPGPAPPGEEQGPLFTQSRSSSPLQLNLLQEELPPEPSRQTPGEAATKVAKMEEEEEEEEEEGDDSGHNDGHSVSSELLDLLLLEDARSATGSAASGSATSVSLASASDSSTASGTSGCGTGSRNGSMSFTSHDSSEVLKRGQKQEEDQGQPWPARRKEEVLKADLARLATMEQHQPRFSEEQKEELARVHPWILTQTLPQEIDTQGCTACDSGTGGGEAAGPEDGSPPEAE